MALASHQANAVGIAVSGGVVIGSIDNSGLIQATAVATGGGGTYGPTGTTGVGFASARATGIGIVAETFAGAVNVIGGTIIAVASGPTASANGIRVADHTYPGATTGYVPPGFGTATGTINLEDATIWAGISNDGGLSFDRGNAIDVSLAPNPIDINLDGAGRHLRQHSSVGR